MILSAEKKYQLLHDIFQKVRDTWNLEEILEYLLDAVKTVLEYDAAGIFVSNQDLVHGRQEMPTEMISGIIRRGFDTIPLKRDEMLKEGKGIIGQVIRTGASVIVPDVRLHPEYVEGRQKTLSEIAVPIIQQERTIGALNLESDRLAAYADSDIEVLQFFADAAGISIEKAKLHRQILEKELLDKQLQTAREVQMRLFPTQPPGLPGYDIAGLCIPADEVGGDYYDFIKLSKGKLGLAIADVSGHGIASALVMTAFRALLRTYARSKSSPARIAYSINQFLPEFTGDHFVTLLYAILDPETGHLSYVSCGHPPPFIFRSDGQILELGCCSPAMGIFKNPEFVTGEATLEKRDVLLMYTDGVADVYDSTNDVFGIDRLKAITQQNEDLPSVDLIRAIVQDTQEFSGNSGYMDDFTLLVIHRL